MQAIEPLIFLAGALIIAGISSAITATYYRHRIHRVYRDSWNQARIFYRHNPPTR
jgi:hypothetical protein